MWRRNLHQNVYVRAARAIAYSITFGAVVAVAARYDSLPETLQARHEAGVPRSGSYRSVLAIRTPRTYLWHSTQRSVTRL